jgi:tRNA modification GTPase
VTDTAGLHQTEDPVERMGMQMTSDRLDQSELILFVIDASDPVGTEDINIFDRIKDRNVILVINKIDLLPGGVHVTLPESLGQRTRVEISARYDPNMLSLESAIFDSVIDHAVDGEEWGIIPNLRQKLLLESAMEAVERIVGGFEKDIAEELMAIELKEAGDALGQILGITMEENLLDGLFQRFCIGK